MQVQLQNYHCTAFLRHPQPESSAFQAIFIFSGAHNPMFYQGLALFPRTQAQGHPCTQYYARPIFVP